MRHDAWLIFEDGKRSKCLWTDISDKGACINLPDAQDIPDDFVLLLAETGSPRRRCRVIWRKPDQLGVKFETRIDERLRAVLEKPSAGTASAAKKRAPAESGV